MAPKDGQHFYLAGGARGEWRCPKPMARSTELLWGLARAEFTGKRTATAQTRLSLLRRLEGAPWARCLTRNVRLSANNLAFARQAVTFGAVRCSHEGAGHTFTCQAVAGECVVAELDVTFTRVD